LSVIGPPLALNREAEAYRCLAEREHQLLALRVIQGRLRWPQQLLQVSEYAVIISSGFALAGNFSGKQREREWRLVL
jgi:hypothetical protein